MKFLIIIPFLFVPYLSLGEDLFTKKEKRILESLKSNDRFEKIRVDQVSSGSKIRMSYLLNQMSKKDKELLEYHLNNGILKVLDKMDNQEAFENNLKKLINRDTKIGVKK